MGVAAGIAGAAAGAALSAVTDWMASGVQWMVGHVVGAALQRSTRIDLSSPWWRQNGHVLLGVAGALLLPLLGAATLSAVLRRDGGRLVRAWAVGLPVATLGGAAGITLTQIALQVVDGVSGSLEQIVAPDLPDVYRRLIDVGGALPGAGAATAALAVIGLLGAGALWLELVLRSAAVELGVLFLPLAMAGVVWPATLPWARRLVEVLAALITSKLIVVGALCLGAAEVGQAGTVDGTVTGLALLLLAAFAPLSLVKLVPLVEAGAVAHLQGLARQPVRVAAQWGGATAARLGGMSGASLGPPPAEPSFFPPGDLAATGSRKGAGDLSLAERLGPAAPPAEGSGG